MGGCSTERALTPWCSPPFLIFTSYLENRPAPGDLWLFTAVCSENVTRGFHDFIDDPSPILSHLLDLYTDLLIRCPLNTAMSSLLYPKDHSALQLPYAYNKITASKDKTDANETCRQGRQQQLSLPVPTFQRASSTPPGKCCEDVYSREIRGISDTNECGREEMSPKALVPPVILPPFPLSVLYKGSDEVCSVSFRIPSELKSP
ncbi:hypothetical protein STEG23_011962, partial [Scotinomys teguina]